MSNKLYPWENLGGKTRMGLNTKVSRYVEKKDNKKKVDNLLHLSAPPQDIPKPLDQIKLPLNFEHTVVAWVTTEMGRVHCIVKKTPKPDVQHVHPYVTYEIGLDGVCNHATHVHTLVQAWAALNSRARLVRRDDREAFL